MLSRKTLAGSDRIAKEVTKEVPLFGHIFTRNMIKEVSWRLHGPLHPLHLSPWYKPLRFTFNPTYIIVFIPILTLVSVNVDTQMSVYVLHSLPTPSPLNVGPCYLYPYLHEHTKSRRDKTSPRNKVLPPTLLTFVWPLLPSLYGFKCGDRFKFPGSFNKITEKWFTVRHNGGRSVVSTSVTRLGSADPIH